MDKNAGEGSDTDARRTRIGFVTYSPLGKGFLTGAMNENTKLDSTDFRSTSLASTPEAMKANQALIDLIGKSASGRK